MTRTWAIECTFVGWFKTIHVTHYYVKLPTGFGKNHYVVMVDNCRNLMTKAKLLPCLDICLRLCFDNSEVTVCWHRICSPFFDTYHIFKLIYMKWNTYNEWILYRSSRMLVYKQNSVRFIAFSSKQFLSCQQLTSCKHKEKKNAMKW